MQKLTVYWVVLALGALACLSFVVIGAAGLNASTPGSRGLGPLGYFGWYFIGAFALWRRPNHPVARRLAVTGTAFITAAALGYGLFQIVTAYGSFSWLWAANMLQQWLEYGAYVAWIAVLAAIPDGAAVRSRERQSVRLVAAVAAVVPLLLLLTHPQVQVDTWFGWSRPPASPLYVSGLAFLGGIAGALWWARFPAILIGAVLLGLRARRYQGRQLIQIEWALLPSVLYVVLNLLPIAELARLFGAQPSTIGELPWEIAFTLTPFALVVGILRHRLLDIEPVIRKSFVYGVLWSLIALTYALLAALLGIAAGQRFPVALAVLVTILATMVFGPARQWLERQANRWVFGERLSRYELLQHFGATLEETFDIDQLGPRVASAIRHGLDVQWVRISLYGDDLSLAAVGEDGVESHPDLTVVASAPLMHAGEVIGRIDCGPKVEGSFGTEDQSLLATLGRQAALAIRNSRLASELADRLDEISRQAEELTVSRTRIVQAGESERRRIERNIHDGVQQEIVALMAKLRLARNQLKRDPQTAEQTLATLQEDTVHALEDLRELARGIHPPVLSDRGLLEAIEAQVARLPMGVAVESEQVLRGRRYAETIEGAAYFLVCEGLANVLKHASARNAMVHLEERDGQLLVEVVDDGAGFVPNGSTGSGLRGLTDRIEALGGHLRVVSRPGEGTTLMAKLPAREGADG